MVKFYFTSCGCCSVCLIALPYLLQILHESIYKNFLDQLVEVYKQVQIGDPLETGTLLGPVHTPTSKENFLKGIQNIKSQVKLFVMLLVIQLCSYKYLYLLSLPLSSMSYFDERI
jgi:delta 1-pyrroline-5-carboxylate dehydrogenase